MQLTVDQLHTLRRAAGAEVRWVPTPGKVESLRMRKDAAELVPNATSSQPGKRASAIRHKLLKPGIRESEVGAEVEYQMRKKGRRDQPFETIVAFGERTALPHARPTAKRLRKMSWSS